MTWHWPAGLLSDARASASAAKSWALIVQGRLHGAKPMTAEAMSVAGRICMEMSTAADELRQAADAVAHAILERYRAKRYVDRFATRFTVRETLALLHRP